MINFIAGSIFGVILFVFWCLLRFGSDHTEIMCDSEEEK